MTIEKTHFKIIVPMYNCALWARNCLLSVLNQTYDNYQLIVCVEPSTDNTYSIVDSILGSCDHKKWILICNGIRNHVPKNHVIGIRESKPENDDVIICLDGDDLFYNENVLSYLNSVYVDENVWITWGSYVFLHNRNLIGKASQPVTQEELNQPRWWRYSHLKTFRYFLYKGIKDEDLRFSKTGDYYTVAGDMALMFPMVEMAGIEHSKFIDTPLYVYNQSTPYNDEKLYLKLVKQCDTEIRSKPKYPVQTKEHLCNL